MFDAAFEAKQYSAAVGANKEISILAGIRIERAEIGAPGEFEHLTDEELERDLFERFIQLFGPKLAISNGSITFNGTAVDDDHRTVSHRPRCRSSSRTLIGLGAFYYGDVALNYSRADSECLSFAERNKVNPAFTPDPNNKKFFVVKKWISFSQRKVVVELGQKMAGGNGTYQSRLCALGDGEIEMPGLFEQWQYR